MSAPVVVTGCAVIGPAGIGREAMGRAIAAGRPLASEVDPSAGYRRHGGARDAGLVPQVDLTPWLPAGQARRMSMPSRWAVAASRMALEEASIASLDGRRGAIVLATAFGPVLFTEKLVRQIFDEGPEAAQPFYFSECVANAAAGQVAIALGARGANVTITQREAGPLLALARAAHEVGEGRADVALAGSTDEVTPLLLALLDRFGSVTRPRADGPGRPQPFDRDRSGFLAGEGASVLVIEREDEARARGAVPLARVVATAQAFDPTATEGDWGTGDDLLGESLRDALERQDVPTSSIDRIVSGASGACRGDRLEGRTLKRAWGGAPLPPVLIPKAIVGEYGGGILAAGVLAVAGAPFGAVAAFETPDPEVMITPHDGTPLEPPHRVLVSSLAAGGAAAWAVLERA
jgi:3-oxoacyl-(acyl-carrier-protein) synthase